MPIAAPRPCTHPGCGRLVHDGSGRCDKHPKPAWTKRPDAVKRVTGRRLQRMRAELFARDPLCAECRRLGLVVLATQRDHIVPLEEGGADEVTNTQGLCDEHHDAKSKAERERGARRAAGRWAAYVDP
ncbi:HNH endonuclease [Paracidovorax cattleyae]|uniref:HNH endonuclease n=1 Tax=Paracidovorax cattleyae TaxID=80868 RepID=UPI0018AFBA43|nr:HNH endonuclease [Paracidovorax cattleyae]MBF9263925.1 HNH endonuclease [Paracidovorax cattleyae]UYL85476.1 HNH endonuclease [Acidovorax phage Aval]